MIDLTELANIRGRWDGDRWNDMPGVIGQAVIDIRNLLAMLEETSAERDTLRSLFALNFPTAKESILSMTLATITEHWDSGNPLEYTAIADDIDKQLHARNWIVYFSNDIEPGFKRWLKPTDAGRAHLATFKDGNNG